MGKSLAQRAARELLRYPPEVIGQLRYRWDLWARPEQIPPPGDWFIYADIGGIGSGKTRSATEWIRSKIENEGPITVGFLARTAKDCRDVMVLGESGILSVFPGAKRDWYRSSHSKVVFPNGSEIIMLTADNPEAIRGYNFHYAWADEVSIYDDDGLAVDNLLNRLRVGLVPQLFITANPRPPHQVPWLAKLLNDPSGQNAIVRSSTTFDNADNLAKNILDRAEALKHTAWGRQEYLGEMVDLSGGLFKREHFRYSPEVPTSGTTIVSIDPALRSNALQNDETGIVVIRRSGQNAYVLDDLSGFYDPTTWGKIVADTVKKYRASMIVAEVSRGWDAINAVIRQFDKTTPVRENMASKSKDLRAMPVQALYEQGRIYHQRRFEKLEEQMVAFDPTTQKSRRASKKATSPDRMDALVWGILELRLDLVGTVPSLAPVKTPSLRTEF